MNWALIAEAMSHLRDRASLEISRPSGDITDGVRFTRDYHPRQFPLLGFLNPPAVSSSNGLPVLFHTSATYGIQRAICGFCTELAPRIPKKVHLKDNPLLGTRIAKHTENRNPLLRIYSRSIFHFPPTN